MAIQRNFGGIFMPALVIRAPDSFAKFLFLFLARQPLAQTRHRRQFAVELVLDFGEVLEGRTQGGDLIDEPRVLRREFAEGLLERGGQEMREGDGVGERIRWGRRST